MDRRNIKASITLTIIFHIIVYGAKLLHSYAKPTWRLHGVPFYLLMLLTNDR